MFNVVRLIDVNADDVVHVWNSLSAVAKGFRHVIAPTLAGSRNGGDLLVHFRFENESQWRSVAADVDATLAAPAVTRVTGADYEGVPTVIDGRAPGTVYRTLLLRTEPSTDAATLALFESDLRMLPDYVSSISAWQLSRPSATVGPTAWTHVFEQEFSEAAGITGPYLMHPVHWAVVDRWFDPECPQVIVRERVCHSFCEAPAPVLH